VGLSNINLPTGIFHKERERVWHDAGQNDFIIFSTKPGTFSYHYALVASFSQQKMSMENMCLNVYVT
jgi:hypothetical protein